MKIKQYLLSLIPIFGICYTQKLINENRLYLGWIIILCAIHGLYLGTIISFLYKLICKIYG